MASIQQEILNILLKRLMERELITEAVYDKAVNVVYSTIDFPTFFKYSACCQKEGETNGCKQD